MTRLAKYVEDARTFPGDARIAWTNEGWRGVLDALAGRTVHRLFRAKRLVVFAQSLDHIVNTPLPGGITLERLEPGQLPLLVYLVGRRQLDGFRRLLANGRIGIVAWREGRPVGYAWVAERLGPDVTLCPIPLPSDAAYLWDLYVVPSERGNGVGTALAAARLRAARDRGFREGWRMITPGNGASLRTLRSGRALRVVGEIRFVQFAGILRARFLPCPPPTGSPS